jgi:hypothetical protein
MELVENGDDDRHFGPLMVRESDRLEGFREIQNFRSPAW